MNQRLQHQRGEGKIGCIISLLIVLLVAAVGYKAIPLYYANNQLSDTAEELGTRAATIPAQIIEKQLRARAEELNISEARAAGAIQVTKTGTSEGTCTIRLRYTRTLDFYGIAKYDVAVDKTIAKPYADYR